MASMAPHLAEVANLVGDLARANILSALMDNRALTAGELAHAARVSPQTTSSHLVKLTNAKLLQVTQQGRHRYYRLASPWWRKCSKPSWWWPAIDFQASRHRRKRPRTCERREVVMTTLPDV